MPNPLEGPCRLLFRPLSLFLPPSNSTLSSPFPTPVTFPSPFTSTQHFYVYMTLPLSLFGCALVAVSQPKQNGAFFVATIVAGLTTSYGSAIMELVGNTRAHNNVLPINVYPYFMMFVVFPPLWLCLSLAF